MKITVAKRNQRFELRETQITKGENPIVSYHWESAVGSDDAPKGTYDTAEQAITAMEKAGFEITEGEV